MLCSMGQFHFNTLYVVRSVLYEASRDFNTVRDKQGFFVTLANTEVVWRRGSRHMRFSSCPWAPEGACEFDSAF